MEGNYRNQIFRLADSELLLYWAKYEDIAIEDENNNA